MKKKLYGLTKGTDLEKMIGSIANAEVNGTKRYYTLARMALEQGLPQEVADTLKQMADQESNHAGFYAMLNASYDTDIFDELERAEKGELGASKALLPLAEQLRALGSEEAALQVEEFTRQETHHGEMIRALLEKYRK